MERDATDNTIVFVQARQFPVVSCFPASVHGTEQPHEGVSAAGEFRLSLDGDPLEVGAEGVVRLVERVTVNGYTTGALQVFCEGEWGGVCITNFDDADALVACRQLGFDSGVALPRGLQRESPLMPNDPVRHCGCRVRSDAAPWPAVDTFYPQQNRPQPDTHRPPTLTTTQAHPPPHAHSQPRPLRLCPCEQIPTPTCTACTVSLVRSDTVLQRTTESQHRCLLPHETGVMCLFLLQLLGDSPFRVRARA